MTDFERMVVDLADRETIRQCLMRYYRAVDRVDEAMLRQVYWPEAIDNHGNYNGPADAFVIWVIPILESMHQTMHFLGNILIEMDGDIGRTEAYFTAYHRLGQDHGSDYCGPLYRQNGKTEWRMAHRLSRCGL